MTAQPNLRVAGAVALPPPPPWPAPTRCPWCRQGGHDGLRAEIACATRHASRQAFQNHIASRYGDVPIAEVERLHKALSQTMGAANAFIAVDVVLARGWRPTDRETTRPVRATATQPAGASTTPGAAGEVST